MAKKDNKEEKVIKAKIKDAEKDMEEIAEETSENTKAEENDEKSAEIEKLQKQISELNDKYMRLIAEYDNYRKRSQKEKDAIYPDAVAATVEKFLPLSDNFERAMSFECKDEEFKKGMVMIENSLSDIFKGLNVESIGEAGEQFDPNMHNAVMHIDDESLGENVITDVFQKGYKIGDKIIRFAMVKVAN